MGNCCDSTLPEPKNITTFGGGRYTASAVAIDSSESNINNNSDEFSNKNFLKNNRKGKYILSSGYTNETPLDSTIAKPDPDEMLETKKPTSDVGVKIEVADRDENKKEILKNEDKMKVQNEDSRGAVLKTHSPQNLQNKATTRTSKTHDHPNALPRPKDHTTEKTRPPRLEKQSKNQPYSLKQLRKAFHHDFQMFLLNNTLLAVQFGVEREIANRARTSTPGNPAIDKRQTEMSDRLSMTGHVYKRALCPDALHEHIFSTGQIRFLPPGAPGSSPGQGVPLRPVRVMICHEDIEVIDQEHVYSAPRMADQTPVIRVGLEQASNQPGYVKMRNLDSKLMNPARSSMTGSYVDIEESEYSRLSDYDTNKSNPPSTSDRHCDEISSSSSLNSEAEDRFESLPPPKRAVAQVQVHRSNDAFMARMPKIGTPTENDVSQILSNHFKEQLNMMPDKTVSQENIEVSTMTRSKSSPNIQYPKSEEEDKKRMINLPLTDKDDLANFTLTERRLSGILGPVPHAKHMRNMNRKKRPLLVPTNQQKTGSNSSNDSSGYNTGNNSFLNVPGSHRSADSTSDSEYGYTTITNINTPQTLEERRKQIKQTGVALKLGLPNTCFVPKTFRHFSEDENSEDLFQTKYYLSSKYFMDNFSNIFAELLAIDLGFAPHAINNATVCGTAITCETTALKLDIIPTVNCPYPNWPEKAIEWLLRSRLQAFDQRTQKPYSWPTRDMVQGARSKGYHLTPIGYAPRRGVNPDLHLEWTLDFPEAEKYLETCLDHVQLRCYIFSLILFQAFFSIADSVNENHLRHVLFWQAENLALAWANYEMFNNIRSIYEYLYLSLSQQNLPNYFMRRRNEFQSIPRSKLHVVQRRIRNFRENPFGHIIAALKHVHIGNDYPKLDYDRLIQILKAHYDVELMNPTLRSMTTRTDIHRVNKQDSDTESTGFWTTVKKDPKRIWNEKYHRQVEQEKKIAKEKAKTQAKQEVTLDNQPQIEINVSKIHLSQNRRVLILELFVKHFIKLAHKSLELKLKSQTYEYLAHTENLFTIMREVESVDEDKLIEIRDELDALSQKSEIIPSKSRMSTTLKGTVRKTPRKQMELPSNAEMFEEKSKPYLSLRKSDKSAEENWRLQKPDSDFSEAHSTDIECNNWRGNRLMRDAPPSMIFLDVDNDESSNL